jgi:hypothetical protein
MKTTIERFEEKIEMIPESGCWVWTAHTHDLGYGRMRVDGKDWLAHRWSYEHYIGWIPKGLVIDHLCRVRCCVNPKHLQPVKQRENCRRGASWAFQANKTHCPKGHPYAGNNLYIDPRGHRRCKSCAKTLKGKL